MSGRRVSTPLEIAREALTDVRRLRGRTVLALIGIAIGTAAVIAMLHVGHNARAAALAQFSSLGTDLLMIIPQASGERPPVVPVEAIYDLPSSGIGIVEAAAIVQNGGMIQVGRAQFQTGILAATGSVYSLSNAQLALGRFTSDLDHFAPFAVVGAGIAADIAQAVGRPVAIGDKITLRDNILTIVGILATTPPNFILSIDFNRSIIVPFEAARRLAPGMSISNIVARFSAGTDDITAATALRAYFQAEVPSIGVVIQTARQMIASIEEQMRIYALLLLGIGTVSLLVGGVGIMNVMLMSVMERRQEIGLRLAIGARRSDIRLMFLSETLALSLIGSTFGTGIGFVAGWIFAHSSAWKFEPAPLALPLGVGMALVVGLFFGIYPASRAARLDPVIALRGE